MGAIIEAGEGWKYFDYGAYSVGLTEHAAKLVLGLESGPWDMGKWWSPILPGYPLHVNPGKKVSLNQGYGNINVSASYLVTEVEVQSPDKGTVYELVTKGDVTKTDLQLPPTIIYKMDGPEAVLQFQQNGVEVLKVINQPDPKVIEI